jgi:hypothetical protein
MDKDKKLKLKILENIKKYAISFTTTQVRISKIIPMLNSLIKQVIQSDIILLNISKSVIVPYIISEYCKKNGVTINVLNRDYGPATKLLGALKYPKINNYDIIITVDDDICYPETMMKHYKILNNKYDNCTFGISGLHYNKILNGINIPITDNLEFIESSVLEGFGSVSYIRKFIDNDIFNIINYPHFNVADDAHLSNYMAKKTNLFVTSSSLLNKSLLNILEYGTESDALHVKNHHYNNYIKIFNFYNLINKLYININQPKSKMNMHNKWIKNKRIPSGNSQSQRDRIFF